MPRSISALLLALCLLVSACSGPQPEARLPFSGASGFKGGAEDTLYYDRNGQVRFQN